MRKLLWNVIYSYYNFIEIYFSIFVRCKKRTKLIDYLTMSGRFERFSSRIIVDLMIIVKVPIFISVIFILPASVRRIATTTLGVLKHVNKFRIKSGPILLFI